MEEMIFRGRLKDFLDSKKLDIVKLIRFGITNEDDLYDQFKVDIPLVDFSNPTDIVRLGNEQYNKAFLILKFQIAGNTEILNYKPTTSYISMMEWLIKSNEIWFMIEEQNLESMKVVITGLIETFKSHLLDVCEDVNIFNSTLRNDISKLVNAYFNKIGKKDEVLEEVRNYLLFNE